MSSQPMEEAFAVYYEGVGLQLQWEMPSPKQAPAIRICALDAQTLLLVTADENLYAARLMVAAVGVEKTLHLTWQRGEVRDIDYCRRTRQLFMVTSSGAVLLQQLKDAFNYMPHAWQTLSFDPLELSEEGVPIDRVCCSAQGVLFATRHTGELYAMGSCGDVFTAEAQPKRVRLFDERRSLLDMAAGDEYFVLLLRHIYSEKDETLHEFAVASSSSRPSAAPRTTERAALLATMTSTPRLKTRHAMDFECGADTADDAVAVAAAMKQEINSDSSLHSFSSSSKSSRSHIEADRDDFEAIAWQLVQHGYALLNTQVHTFGAANNGLLGTGDHIKRQSINNLQKLDAIGVCGIAAGQEHTVARTLDGRLFQWGRNGKHQLVGHAPLIDVSAPSELQLDGDDWDAQQRQVLAACCGDYETVLLNARGGVMQQRRQLAPFSRDFVALQMGDRLRAGSVPLLLSAGAYSLHNRHQRLQQQHHGTLNDLRVQLRVLLKYRHAVQMLGIYQQKSSVLALRQLQPLCAGFQRMMCLHATLLHSLEGYYRGDFAHAADMLFVKHHRVCIELFEDYTRAYADIYAIDGFSEAAKVLGHVASVPLMPDAAGAKDDTDLACIFRQPLQTFPHCLLFVEQLLRTQTEFTEHVLACQEFMRQQRIALELAESTQNFWQQNERNMKIRDFRRQHRRVVLSSSAVPLKLGGGHMISMTSVTFVLFSDCLLQVGGGNQMLTYPLSVLWARAADSDPTALQISTPERSFTLCARTSIDRKLWLDQLESSVMAALGRAHEDARLANMRTALYVYSRQHGKYSGVRAYGHWLNAQLHGNCYLEYPDGRVYYGQMRMGEIEGFGKMVLPATGLYEGHFHAGKFHGHGTYELKENEVYEGNFRDGLYHGHGTLRGNNYTYVGEYQAHARSGYGVYDDMLTGDKYMGMFADNKRAGAGICITMNGDYFEGVFANDELSGSGIAVLEHDYYYEGELSIGGPCGKGTYYMPSAVAPQQDTSMHETDEFANRQMVGNILSGQLAGGWHDVRITVGSVALNRNFHKYPKSIGELVVDNNRKWRALFDDFEAQLYGDCKRRLSGRKHAKSASNAAGGQVTAATRQLWACIAAYMTAQRERERLLEQHDTAYNSTQSNFAKNISLGFGGPNSHNSDKLSLKSTNSLCYSGGGVSGGARKSSLLDVSCRGHSHSQETLCFADMLLMDSVESYSPPGCGYSHQRENSFSSLQQLPAPNERWANASATTASLRSSVDSALNLSGSYNNSSNNNNNNSYSLEFVPHFGISNLEADDVSAIKAYLQQAFHHAHHPLSMLNSRVANCFYSSYGCWKVKPTPILAKQAMREWESISRRMYKFLRKMFPALPDDYIVLEGTREVISHTTLLYPIVLSEGIYSTLFVLYANKYSAKDEIYRQNLLCAEKLQDVELAACVGLESSLLSVVGNDCFLTAIETLKQLQEKFSPKAMLTVIELCMEQITDAHKMAEHGTSVIIGADSMMPLTLLLVLRAAVPHLGAELALLDDLTGGANFQFEMNGMAGYCYTTLKAAYEHITAKPLNKA